MTDQEPGYAPGALAVHLPCLQVHGPTSYGMQTCSCEPAASWPGCDVSRLVDLCTVCARGVAGGVSRWAWTACENCVAVELHLRDWLGMCLLPLGRHSIMNGVGHPVGAPLDEHREFAGRVAHLSLGWERLHQWGDEEARRLSDTLPDAESDIALEDWLRAFPTSVSASVDAFERLLGVTLPPTTREAAASLAQQRADDAREEDA